jgi:integral membrane sensor domain MASE1
VVVEPGIGNGGAVVNGQPVERLAAETRLADDSRVRYVAGAVLLTALYYVAVRASEGLNFAGASSSIVWLPGGVGVAFLYFAGIRFWPGVLVGELLTEDIQGGQALSFTLLNTVEVIAAALLLHHLSGADGCLARYAA